jgi:hypothetical protein
LSHREDSVPVVQEEFGAAAVLWWNCDRNPVDSGSGILGAALEHRLVGVHDAGVCGDPLPVNEGESLDTGEYGTVGLGRELEQDLVLGPLSNSSLARRTS